MVPDVSPKDFKNYADLAKLVAASDAMICFEGCPAAGKSTLASRLSISPPRTLVRVDAFARRRRYEESSFRSLVQKNRLNDCLRSAGQRVILEGVLARELLDEEFGNSAIFIYIKRLGAVRQSWDFGDTLLGPRPDCFLHDEVYDYHHNERPHDRAHAIFEWIEAS